jgi:nitrogen regulatory protein PII
MIIEQIPNESLKIQTADGSIFVYDMAQVAKIAKEQK